MHTTEANNGFQLMKEELENKEVMQVNIVAKDEGQTFSPRDMVLGGQKIDYKSLCKIHYGAYVQV